MHVRHCKLREKQQDRLAEFFVAGVTARAAADLLGIHRNSAALFYHRLRQIIAAALGDPPAMEGEIEVDESYFGGHRKGKRGRGAAGKVPVFGLLKRGGHVYTVMLADTRAATLCLSSARKLLQIQSFTQMAMPPMKHWMSPSSATNGSSIMSLSLPSATISMALRTSGARPSDICVVTTVSRVNTFTCS